MGLWCCVISERSTVHENSMRRGAEPKCQPSIVRTFVQALQAYPAGIRITHVKEAEAVVLRPPMFLQLCQAIVHAPAAPLHLRINDQRNHHDNPVA